jgi:hypothetical protein
MAQLIIELFVFKVIHFHIFVQFQASLFQEINLLKNLKHLSIVEIYGYFQEVKFFYSDGIC